MVKIDISAEPATPPEAGVKVHVRKGADMGFKICCSAMGRFIDIEGFNRAFIGAKAIDGPYLFGNKINYCPYCGKKLESD